MNKIKFFDGIGMKNCYKFFKPSFVFIFMLLNMSNGFSKDEAVNLAPSLLIDVYLDNTTPAESAQFCYKIRYRCASATEHCEDAYIDLVLPEGMEVSSLPSIGGNVVTVITSPASPSGTYIRIDLASPTDLGLPSNILSTGSSGIFSVCAKWTCSDAAVQNPATGSNVNITGPTFYASSNSETASTPLPVTVPTFNGCPEDIGSSGAYQKVSNNWNKNTTPGGLYKYRFDIPAHTGPVTFLDTFPEGLFLSQIILPVSWTLELKCDNNWFTIPASYNSNLLLWMQANEISGTLDNLLIDPSLPPDPANQTGCAADTSGVSTVVGFGYKTGFTGIRFTTPAGSNSDEEANLQIIVDESVVSGSEFVNCIEASDPSMGKTCATKRIIVTDGPNILSRKEAESGLGDTSIPDDLPLNTMAIYPSLTKQNDDILWQIVGVIPQTNGNNITGFSLTDTLPLGLTFDTDPVDGNWFVTAIADKSTIPFPYDPFDQQDCMNPTFTTSFAPDGRMVLDWNFNTCTYYAGFPSSAEMTVYFTTRFDRTIVLPASFENESIFRMNDGTQVWCGDGFVGQTATDYCTITATSEVAFNGGDINTSKWVKGMLDNDYSRYPNSGLTDTSGIATYELIIEAASLEGVTRLEIVDILAHIGDSTLITGVPRNSEWSTELAGPLVIQKFDIITQTWVDASADIVSALYGTTYNPCYLDGASQVKAAIGLTEPVSAGCSSTDFSATNPVVGAKAFALIWENITDPLMFGESLRISVPIKQLNGEANVANGKIASNSFASTATETDGDELFSSEPLKVNLQMLDLDVNVSIGDYIWKDANANGIQDPNELPIGGVTVSLFDLAGNPVMIGGEPAQKITDQFGNYEFSGLDPNTTYLIRLDELTDFNNAGSLSNLNLTQPSQGVDDNFDSDAALIGNFPSIYFSTGDAGTSDDTNDFGFYEGGVICGYAWFDMDADGIQGGAETPLDSVLVQLINQGGAVIASTTTDANGVYNFPLVIPGSYTLQVTNQSTNNYIITIPNATSNDHLDSDANVFSTIGPIVINGGDYSCDHDVGYREPVLDDAIIRGTVWDELINDGIQDANETGVAGIQVNLLDAAQFVIATSYTDADGDYLFNNIIPNEDYYVNVIPGINNPITIQDAGTDDTVDSDVDVLTGITAVMTPTPNQVISNVDAGIIFPYSIGNQVWIDTNGNGMFDNNEGVVPGAEIYLFDVTNGVFIDTTIADVNGKFVFTDLQPGDYLLELLLPTDLISTTDVTTSINPNDVDGDDNGIGILNATHIKSSVITIVQGGGNVGDPNWIETDHGQAINGAFDLTSNPKAYYTLDFGLQYKLDCSIPVVEYAITDGGITQAGQTTDYFYPGNVQNLKSTVNHVPQSRQEGVIRCFDFCEFGQWTYYFNPMDPEEYLFAIDHGTNVTPIEYIELRVDDVPADRYAISADHATFVMIRDWYVRTVDDAPLLDALGNPTTVDIRFYFPEEEFQEILDAAIAQAAAWGGYLPTITDVYWFKRTTFDPATDIDDIGSLLTPADIKSLRNAGTSAMGVNTKDGIVGQTGNGKNHIQFNGITGFSGGTAAITIHKSALPAALAAFEIDVENCNAKLTWQAASDVNFSHYIIEKSVDGNNFEFVNHLETKQSPGFEQYDYTDYNIKENYFYRLKLLNLDGTYSYSNVITTESDCIGDMTQVELYPNPISVKQASLQLNFYTKKEATKWISITDSYGEEKLSFSIEAVIGKNSLSVDISNLVPGLHVLTVKGTKGKWRSERFVVVRE